MNGKQFDNKQQTITHMSSNTMAKKLFDSNIEMSNVSDGANVDMPGGAMSLYFRRTANYG
jgi:hypothetical protein